MPRKRSEKREYRLVRVRDKRYPDGYRPDWYISWTGCTTPKTTNTPDKGQAERALEIFKQADNAPDEEGLLVGQILDEYLRYKKDKYLQTNAAINNYKSLEYKLVYPREYFGHFYAPQITRRMGRDFYQWRHKKHKEKYLEKHKDLKDYKPISNATIKAEGTIFNAAMKHGYDEERVEKLISIELPQEAPPRDRWLSDNEIKRLLEKCETYHVKLFTIVALNTAQRKTAILELQWSQVDMRSRIIDFNPPGRYITNKRRSIVPINDQLYAFLQEAWELAKSDYVIEFNSKPIKEILIAFSRAADKAGLKEVSPHTLRHTAACRMAQKKIPIQEIAAILGDSIRTVEKHYLKYSKDYLNDAVKALNVL